MEIHAPELNADTSKESMAKDLVIVESPAKARTVQRFLGNRYVAKASLGHVRDLPKSQKGAQVAGVAVEDGSFSPTYRVTNGKIVSELSKDAKNANTVYLATDPDREGEAISWHLMHAAKIPANKIKRVVFHEITQDAVDEAFENPREIDQDLIDAQQARRVLDRIVGYRLSGDVLWKKVRRGLSAGRVQSVALKIVVEREGEIDVFVPEEYWTIDATLSKRPRNGSEGVFKASLHSIKGVRGKIKIPDQVTSDEIVADLKPAGYRVSNVRVRESRSRPAPPFITSTLQQEAWRKLRFTARRTMAVAQQLYEGLSIGSEGSVGLITYMRTDSTNIAAQALQETAEYIKSKFGPDFAPVKPRAYRRRVKGAQEAHEAIRPTSVMREPSSIRRFLSNEQARLYDLVWKRMVASQMSDALFDSTNVSIDTADTLSGKQYQFRATGSVLKFAGFRAVYMEGADDGAEANGSDDAPPIPHLLDGEALDCLGIRSEQHFTQPPPRFTEASLVKALEEQGIGRPSTYAPTIATLLDRDYVLKESGRFKPTKLGRAVTGLLVEHFPDIMDVGFTARVEEELDDIAEGEREWTPVIREFYRPFDKSIEKAVKEAERVPRELLDEETDEVCEKCESPMVIKSGRFGRFLACTGYPECKNTRPIESDEERAVRERVSEETDEVCEKCERPMAVKTGRNGRFLACTGYPKCKNSKPFRVGVNCPDCAGALVERKQRGRNGRVFYGCINYPECKFAVNPLPQPCPDCGKLLVSRGRGRKYARCLDGECGYNGPVPDEEPEESSEMASSNGRSRLGRRNGPVPRSLDRGAEPRAADRAELPG